MVLPLCSSAFDDRDHRGMYRCNFWAKVGDNADDASASLFFAELYIVEARWRSRLKLLSEVLHCKDHLDEDEMVEVFEAEPLDESEHGPGAKPGDLRVLSCVKLEGGNVHTLKL